MNGLEPERFGRIDRSRILDAAPESGPYWLNRVVLVAVFIVALGLADPHAQTLMGDAHDRSLPIEITANSLEVRQDQETAIFRGEVRAIQGEMRLTADELVVHYRQGVDVVEASISRIDAQGRVFFSTPSETAQGNQGVYDVDDGVITLTGSVVLTRGENVIRGERLVLDLETGQSVIESGTSASGSTERVKGVFFPKTRTRRSAAPGGGGNREIHQLNGLLMTDDRKLTRGSPPEGADPVTPRLVAENEGLAARNIGKRFKKRPVLRDISLAVNRGEAVGLLGPNGAGKTTCFYVITGLLMPDYGTVTLDGHDITDLPMYRRARLGLGYLPQEASVFRGLSVENNIRAVIEVVEPVRDRRETMLDDLLAEFSISHLRRTPVLSLSGGERRRVEIARALACRPSFMLLDEPLAGIDPIAVGGIRDVVSHLKDRGIGVLITEHNVRETLDIIDRAYILHEGRVLMEGAPEEIVAHEDVRRVYLGDRFSL